MLVSLHSTVYLLQKIGSFFGQAAADRSSAIREMSCVLQYMQLKTREVDLDAQLVERIPYLRY